MAWDSEYADEAPFNFAIATLMRIDKDLKDISVLTLAHSGEAQHAKIEAVKNLFRNSVILIKREEDRNNLREELKSLSGKNSNKIDTAGQLTGTVKTYDKDLDDKIELFILKLEEKLQESGSFFMPKKQTEDLF